MNDCCPQNTKLHVACITQARRSVSTSFFTGLRPFLLYHYKYRLEADRIKRSETLRLARVEKQGFKNILSTMNRLHMASTPPHISQLKLP
jgi:hypothetical protein